jgi:UDP-N-acetylmuramyl pentapeptide phosphotransferase/UDP-N-acetylglucosamine-1-phosphate transferase
MSNSILILSLSILLLISLNFILKKFHLLIDINTISAHKISLIKTPLSGGIYFFFSFIVIDYFYQIRDTYFYVFFFCFMLLGLLADTKNINNPKIRFILQLLITISFVYFTKLSLEETRLLFLDSFLYNHFFNQFFLIFCFMTLLNGSNFIDGLNGFLTSYFALVILAIILIDPLLDIKLLNFEHLKFYLMPMICFIILNLFNKNFLGDGGSYFISIFFGLNLIDFINDNNNQIAPFLIVNLLWYPCFENLFTIFRRSNLSKTIYLPDQNHLHTLLYIFVLNKFNKKIKSHVANSLSSILLLLCLMPMFILSFLFYDSSIKLFYCLMIYILTYLYIYQKLTNNEKSN